MIYDSYSSVVLLLILLFPFAGALAVLFAGHSIERIRLFALLAVALNLILSSSVLFGEGMLWSGQSLFWQIGVYDTNPLIPYINASFGLELDGLSSPLVVLTNLLGFVAIIASWSMDLRVREYYFWLLLLLSGVIGVFLSTDLLFFFLFWEIELVPMYLLISVWGTGNKQYSAMKFVLYTLLGSGFMLMAILALRFSVGSFGIHEITIAGQENLISAPFLSLYFIYIMLLLGFLVKLPVWPFHTWLPDAHTDAPTAVSILLAGILLKMGGYGLIRMNLAFFPDISAEFSSFLSALAAFSIIYGAVIVFRQTDIKRVIAYSSVSHMGLVLLGVSSTTIIGVTGAALQMVAHGTITGLLFLVVGLIYDRTHTRHIPHLGGLISNAPIIGISFIFGGLASLGLPFLSGFVAELTVFIGSYSMNPLQTAVGAFGIVLTAGYILWTVERVFYGSPKEQFSDVKDTYFIDKLAIILLIVPIIGIGVYPKFIFNVIKDSIIPLVGN